MLRILLLGAVIAAACTGGTSAAATWFVATDGDDSNPGTESRPWKTLRKAANSVSPGDVVRIRAGDYSVAPTWRVGRAGTAQAPITYAAYGDGQVRITPSSILPASAWTHIGGHIYSTPVAQPVLAVFRGALPLHASASRAAGNAARTVVSVDTMMPGSFHVLENILYVWLEDGSHPRDSTMRVAPGHVVSLYDCSYSIFDGLTVEFGFNGFKDQGRETRHITIRNCTIRSIASQGIQPVARDCIIEGNLFQKIGSSKYEHGIYGSKPGTIIRHNIFEEIAGAGIHQYNQTAPAGGNCQFYGNTFRNPRKMTVRSGREEYYLDIIAWGEGGNLIHSNRFFGEAKRGGISLNSPDNRVYHNTFVGSTYGVTFYAGRPGNRVMNNIILDARTFVVWPAKAAPQFLDHNLYFNRQGPARWEHDGAVHRSFEDYRRAAGEARSRHADPRLSPADARPLPGSPAIDAGTALPDVPADFAGAPRPRGAGPDIGAFEHQP
jgi:hypothetical protein